MATRKTIILLLIILLLGGVFRFWGLKNTPPGLYPDEAVNGMNAQQSLKVFYPENNGREGLFIWLIALSFKLFGASAWSLRLASAVIGFLTILGLFFLTKELFNEKIALLSSFFLSVSFWHVNFSRIGFRAIFVPFLMCFAFYFLFRGKKIWRFILAGIFFGLGFYTYIAFRMAVLVLGVFFLIKIWDYWKKNRKWSFKKTYLQDGWWRWDVFFITVLIVVLPLCLHFYQNPGDFMGRANDVSIFSSSQPLKALTISAVKTLGMFNFVGDWNWRHNYSGAPMLAWTVGILFLIGLIIAFKRFKEPVYAFLLSWFFIMLLPAVLTVEGIPHSLRTIGVLPPVYIFSALGFVWLSQRKMNKNLLVIFLTAMIIHPVFFNFNQYFLRWAKNPDVTAAFRQDLVDVGKYVDSLSGNIYVIVNDSGVPVPYPDGPPMPAQTVMFTSQKEAVYLKPEEIDRIEKSATIILLRPDEKLMNQLSKRWPLGEVKKDGVWSLRIYE